MDILFLTCAIFGGTVLVAQFLLGFGGEEHGDEGSEDAPDYAGESHDGGGEAHDDGDHHDAHHNSTWMFGVLSFRTIMIGLTFFGLTGKAASASEFAGLWPLVIAIGCGLAAMYGVYFLMRGLHKLTADGTERIGRAVGSEGIVYLTVPGNNAGLGKVQVPLQNRTVELEAMTAGERLPTGTRIVVVEVLGAERVAIEAATESTATPPEIEQTRGNTHV